MISRRRYRVAVAALLVAGAVAAVIVWLTRPAQVTLSMRPVRPLTTAACVAEAHRYGYSLGAGRIICPSWPAPRWYHAVLVNKGSYALIDCSATGYDSGGKAVFHGSLSFTFAGIRGLFARHGTTTFYWYLPKPTAYQVVRYATKHS